MHIESERGRERERDVEKARQIIQIKSNCMKIATVLNNTKKHRKINTKAIKRLSIDYFNNTRLQEI